MTQVLSNPDPVEAEASSKSASQQLTVPKEYLDPPSPWNPTVGLFLGGYGLAALRFGSGVLVIGLYKFWWHWRSSPCIWKAL